MNPSLFWLLPQYPVPVQRPVSTLPEFWIAVVAFIALIVAGIQAIFFFQQLELIRKSLDDTKLAAEAAKRAADHAEASVLLARDTARHQLRAYVLVDKIMPDRSQKPPDLPHFMAYRVIVKNFGATPAYEVRTQTGALTGPIDPRRIDFSIQDSTAEPLRSYSTIGPGQWFDTVIPHGTVTSHQQEDWLTKGLAAYYVYGFITYKDAFGAEHVSRFRHVRLPNTHALVACREGNDAD